MALKDGFVLVASRGLLLDYVKCDVVNVVSNIDSFFLILLLVFLLRTLLCY